MTMATKSSAGKRSGKTRKPPKTSLEARVAALEKRIGVPHETQDFIDRVRLKGKSVQTASVRALKTFKALASDAVAATDVVDMVFDLDANTTAKLARVYLPGSTQDIANSQKPHGVLANQIVGNYVTVIIEVAGKPDDIGVFDIQHATPSSIQLKVSDGPTGSKPLLVTP
jgi:hypothetical protein